MTTISISPSLHKAVIRRDRATVKKMIALEFPINGKDEFGLTALHYAAKFSDYEMTELLIKSGADVMIENDFGMTAIDLCTDDNVRELFVIPMCNQAYIKSLPAMLSSSI